MSRLLVQLMTTFLPDVRELRPLALATLVNTVGSGMTVTVLPLYLVRVAGLTPAQIGMGLGAGALAGLLCGIPAGVLADRRGPRGVMIGLIAAMGAFALCYPLVSSFWPFLVIAVITGGLDRGVATVAAALIAGAATGPARVQARASLRVALNLGLTLGAALSSIALSVDTPAVCRVVLVLDGLTYFGAAAMYLRLRPIAPVRSGTPARGRVALRDRRYVTVTTLLAALQVNAAILSVALP